ncbi:GGDEF domain-containing protein [Nocardia sp. NBC_00565]|uniref:GGDEF domain-containing protein n=1 Tax=Nocardia sp. NBC_00565 TaxID=2975993 RepID=UPI002E8212DE|nr:GGDEF domain-containing protein [Nocardia sp. NBC_00565]WUC03635.1 GGDEF domain-containing protein [Nocardia sp. NBC_00565]
MSADIEPSVAQMAGAWACAVCAEPGSHASPQQLQPVLVEIIERLLLLARSEPFPVPEARMLGARLVEAPFERTRMLAQATRWLLGFPAGATGSLVATRWPLVASQAIDSYAQALQERALAQQKQDLSAAVSLRVQEITALQHRLRHEATHDALTDLANRTLLQDKVRLMAADPNRGVGLLVVDLDRFKQINDSYGHAVGDEVLVELARRLREICLPDPDTVICRYGGDEFVLATNPYHDTLGDIAHRIVAALRDPVWSTAGPVPVSASVGTAYCPPGDSCDFTDLLRLADHAMYSAKTAGGRRFALAETDKPEIKAVAG